MGDETPKKGLSIHLCYPCIQCGARLFWVGYHSHELFVAFVTHPGFLRIVIREGVSVKGNVMVTYDINLEEGARHAFFRSPLRDNRDLMHVAVHVTEESGNPSTSYFLARRVYLEVAQTRMRMWLARRRRARECARLAFAMGAHLRLGRASAITRCLSHDAVSMILRAIV
jgi:hypothetical protein